MVSLLILPDFYFPLQTLTAAQKFDRSQKLKKTKRLKYSLWTSSRLDLVLRDITESKKPGAGCNALWLYGRETLKWNRKQIFKLLDFTRILSESDRSGVCQGIGSVQKQIGSRPGAIEK